MTGQPGMREMPSSYTFCSQCEEWICDGPPGIFEPIFSGCAWQDFLDDLEQHGYTLEEWKEEQENAEFYEDDERED